LAGLFDSGHAVAAAKKVEQLQQQRKSRKEFGMTVQSARGALTAVALAGAVAIVAPVHAQLPPADTHALVTVVGCLQMGGKHGDEYVLSDLTAGPATSTEEANCASSGAQVIRLKRTRQFGFNDSMLNRWIEITGRLEKEESDDPNNLRELEIRSFSMVPVIPRRAEAAPSVSYQPAPAERMPEPAPQPRTEVGTTGVAAELPRTASGLPPVALMGLLSLAGAFGLNWYRVYARG
jgi:hypothetical protein